MAHFINSWIQFFVLLTPFFALSMFILYTADNSSQEKKVLALKVALAVLVMCLALFFLGNAIFRVVGITIDSFRVGAGILLFLSAVALVQSSEKPNSRGGDVTVVPLAIPIIVGPATTGAILISGAQAVGASQRLATVLSLVAAVACIGIILFSAEVIERVIKARGIAILSKLTGLVLSAMASQMVFDGARNLLK